MNCKQCQLLIFDHVDGVLGCRQKGLVEAHLAHCRQCRDYLCREQEMRSIITGDWNERLNALKLSPVVRQKVINAVRSDPGKRLWIWIKIPRPVWALAAGLMLALISVSLYLAVANRPKQIVGVQSATDERQPPLPESIMKQLTPEQEPDSFLNREFAMEKMSATQSPEMDAQLLNDFSVPYKSEDAVTSAECATTRNECLDENILENGLVPCRPANDAYSESLSKT